MQQQNVSYSEGDGGHTVTHELKEGLFSCCVLCSETVNRLFLETPGPISTVNLSFSAVGYR